MTKKLIWTYRVVVCLLLLVCMVRGIQDRRTQAYFFSGDYRFSGDGEQSLTVFEDITLAPGIYEFRLDYATDRDYSGHCDVLDDTLPAGKIRTNGEHFYAGRTQTEFYLWLFAPTDAMRVTASYDGMSSLEIGDLTIQNTGKLWSVRFVLILGAALAAFVLRCLFVYHKRHGSSATVWRTALFLLIITAIASYTQVGGYLTDGADLTYHLQRIEGVKDSILAGQFPVRIEPEWLYGYGYANGIFYCDSLLYFPALLRLSGFTVTTSYNIYCICLNFATAAIAYYCFGKIFKDGRIGLMCSALYTLSILRLYKLAVVGAVGEGSAVTFLPLVFYGMYRVFAENRDVHASPQSIRTDRDVHASPQSIRTDRDVHASPQNQKHPRYTAWIPLTLGYASLIQTHVLTCEITALLTILICLICIRKILKRPVFVTLAKGALGALGLSFWYIVPFLDYYLTQDMHIRHVSGRTIQGRGLYFAQLFVNSWSQRTVEWLEERGMTGVETVGPGTLCMLALCFFFLLWFMRLVQKKYALTAEEAAVWRTAKLSALFACLLLAMTLHRFPWNRIQESSPVMASLVSSLQFPNRFLGWAMVFLIMVFGTCVWYFRHRRFACLAGTVLVILSVATGALVFLKDSAGEEHRMYLYNEEGMGFGYISGGEYLVQGTDDLLLTFGGPVAGEGVEIAEYSKRYQDIRLSCVNASGAESYVDLPLLRYKGYRAQTRAGERLSICAGENNVVRVLLPVGFSGELTVGFVSPFYWRISEMITLFAICIITWNCIGVSLRGTAAGAATEHQIAESQDI